MIGNGTPALAAFQGYGVELEYMIVDRHQLSPVPIADQLLRAATDVFTSDVDRGLLGWSNEMALHVIEIKNRRPAAALESLPIAFQTEVRYINRILELFGARLMPTAMHPWMDPRREMRLWPHANAELYQTYGRIFDCNSHGWANLQSMHINLPFANDGEFARLHAAVRLVLPILPALAASSPIAEGSNTGFADFRMEAYRNNAQSIESITGQVIPETVSSRADYERIILAPMYRDIAPHDPQHILQHEWLNSRGAIARFDRNAIEIRVIDTQECPQADLAIAAATVAVVEALYVAGPATRGSVSSALPLVAAGNVIVGNATPTPQPTRGNAQPALAPQQEIGTDALAAILLDCIRSADQAVIDDARYLALIGFPGSQCTAHELWHHLIETIQRGDRKLPALWHEPLQTILEQGPLARRILRAVDGDYSSRRLTAVYRQLCDCLQEGRMFMAAC
ncbi:MAG TPA: glutamate-cysteine ligase family protein [Burkholderiaceae bacterium]|nr:glutamate-cysteine ligase family protein [Burkholderiaceae bacterium]